MDEVKYSKISPILLFGIFIFVLPFLAPIIGKNLPNWFLTVGVIIILIGAGHSAAKSMR